MYILFAQSALNPMDCGIVKNEWKNVKYVNNSSMKYESQSHEMGLRFNLIRAFEMVITSFRLIENIASITINNAVHHAT